MSKPVKPVVPPPALRSEPDTFKDRAEANIEFFEPLVDYMDALADFVDEQADAAVAAAQAGDLPAIAGKAGQLLKVNAGGTGLEFQPVVGSKTDASFGRLLTTGSFGIGEPAAPPTLVDFDAVNVPTGLYRVDTTTLNRPAGLDYGVCISGRINSTSPVLLVVSLDFGDIWSRAQKVGVWSAWQRSLGTNDYPSQAQAEAGADNTKVMTPLRTKQAIMAAVGQEIIVTDVKPQGTASQTVVTGYNVRELNTIERNTISGASLASNLISLPAGTYEIDANIATGFVGVCRLKVAGSVSGDLILGAGMNLNNGSLYAQQNIAGTFTLASTENISIEQYVQTARANGAGTYANIAGEAELYARVRIKKLV
ncbi:pyocin knob domain-containing protein [Roseovarius nubinhibens]|uniref:pyocin knob domain-containing protein n=1 Tax=Roseovarius nubinhibens TaxID=314263 RepID=UPI0030EB21BD